MLADKCAHTISCLHTSHRASSEPSVEDTWCGEESRRGLVAPPPAGPPPPTPSLYSLSSSWTKWESSSPLLRVTPHTGQQDGSGWNFFLPGEHKMLLRQNAVLLMAPRFAQRLSVTHTATNQTRGAAALPPAWLLYCNQLPLSPFTTDFTFLSPSPCLPPGPGPYWSRSHSSLR